MSNKFNFTIKTLAGIPPPSKNRSYHYDSKVNGLGLAVSSTGNKSFFVYRKVKGIPKRITLGKYPDLTIEQARNKALDIIRKVADGIDPVAEKREQAAQSVTLAEVFEAYLNARKNLKPITIKDYSRIMLEVFPDWQNKCLKEITKDMVAKRHTKFGEQSRARANNAMRVLRALFNFAMGEYEDSKGQSLFLENPVKRLSHTRAWYRVTPKQGVIKDHELKAWFDGVMSLKGEAPNSKAETVRDYLLIILFCGLRRQEAAKLTWDRVDFKDRTLTIIDTKNHQPHTLPLSDFIFGILKSRQESSNSIYVFPGQDNNNFIVEPRKQMAKVISKSGVAFTLHDLRRTFITIAESLDIAAYTLKQLLNHKMRNDVTAGYIIINVDRLRGPTNKIEQYILSIVTKDL
jgi:integrase